MIGPKTTLVLKRDIGPYPEVEWITIKKVKGVLSTLGGEEMHIWGGVYITASHHFYMDYPKGFTVTEIDEFWLGEREFNIEYITNLGANQNNRLKIVLDEVS